MASIYYFLIAAAHKHKLVTLYLISVIGVHYMHWKTQGLEEAEIRHEGRDSPDEEDLKAEADEIRGMQAAGLVWF